ncbi:MAG TPA: hypothetical protein VMF89_34160, partial [Polyangiales bacterium]|nr:hypothetical protein [Polyangiales bacterium]
MPRHQPAPLGATGTRGSNARAAAFSLTSGVCLGATLFPHQRAAALAVVAVSLLVALPRAFVVAEEASPPATTERWAPLCVA